MSVFKDKLLRDIFVVFVILFVFWFVDGDSLRSLGAEWICEWLNEWLNGAYISVKIMF